MEVITINDSNINEMITKNEKVVIDCFAEWCGPCKMLSPIIDELAEETNDTKFYKINIDDNYDTVSKYKIMSIPTILVFKNGELKNKSIGLKSKEELKEVISILD